jgi:molybdate transport system substrate-binding protein
MSELTAHRRASAVVASLSGLRPKRAGAAYVALSLALSCGRAPGSDDARVELVVYAATSTRDVLQALEATFEREHAVDLVFNFGSSGDLSRQIVAAAKADVFLSADDRELERVEAAGLVAAGTRRALLSNQLVVVEPADAPSIFSLPFVPQQLAGAGVERLSLANVETVPAGRYAKAWLERVGVWKDVAARVLPGVDVRAALAAVESAGANVGIVYRSDAARSTRARIVFAVPFLAGPAITYPIAALADRPSVAKAREYITFLGGGAARLVFAQHGFVALDAAGDPAE